MFSKGTKTLLKNFIRHTDTHNRILEENEMWNHHKGRRSHSAGTEVKRMRSTCQQVPRAHMDRHDADMGEQYDQHVRQDGESTYWRRKLQKQEEGDPHRWGHSGYKQMYPGDFYSDRSRSRSSSASSGDRKLRTHKKKKKKHQKKKKKSSKKSKKRKRSHPEDKSRAFEKVAKVDEQEKTGHRDGSGRDSRSNGREMRVSPCRGEHDYRDPQRDCAAPSRAVYNRDIQSSSQSVRTPREARASRGLISRSSRDGQMFSRALRAVTQQKPAAPPARRAPTKGQRSEARPNKRPPVSDSESSDGQEGTMSGHKPRTRRWRKRRRSSSTSSSESDSSSASQTAAQLKRHQSSSSFQSTEW